VAPLDGLDRRKSLIQFTCQCGKPFSVPDEFGGRRARCKQCGNTLTVPLPEANASPVETKPAAPPKLSVRLRRLTSDAQQMRSRFAGQSVIRILRQEGDPPERYEMQFNVKSIERLDGDKPVLRHENVAQIQLTSEYPRQAPLCRMLTPIFHPNIDAATICIGDHWAAGERLVDLVVRIGEMITYQAYNIRSPLNGEAAMWADLNADRLPIDPRNLHAEESV